MSKLWLDVSLIIPSAAAQHLRVDNDKAGFKKLVVWIRKFSKQQNDWVICMEHTGIYAQPLWYFLNEKNIAYYVVPDAAINAGLAVRRGKSDKADSLTIAKFIMRCVDDLRPNKISINIYNKSPFNN